MDEHSGRNSTLGAFKTRKRKQIRSTAGAELPMTVLHGHGQFRASGASYLLSFSRLKSTQSRIATAVLIHGSRIQPAELSPKANPWLNIQRGGISLKCKGEKWR